MITYQRDVAVSPEEVADLYRRAELRRPIEDLERIGRMVSQSNLTYGAYADGKLVGYARSVTDFCYCCYLSDLAVDPAYQGTGVGKALIAKTQEAIGEETMLLLLAAPTANTYYPHVGFQHQERAWFIPRAR
ncbi:MAG: GCN5-related N-acetyltransferase [Cyanobacteria bacterium RYN_339]|nr:GCN5-related N-acetyltransferase [Cyanobacteria bacterium RYN_339]